MRGILTKKRGVYAIVSPLPPRIPTCTLSIPANRVDFGLFFCFNIYFNPPPPNMLAFPHFGSSEVEDPAALLVDVLISILAQVGGGGVNTCK